ncbi:hypothetical protein EV368DRAFT_89565 [Lentinula lateritia]|nr:hypothetical protein EV368DRAFT_89565 [Lentinula lateritia]
MSKLARKILDEFLKIDDSADWKNFTIPADELGLYLADPDVRPVSISPMKLDTSPDTAAKMRDALWNQMVTSFLSVQASEHASLRPGFIGSSLRLQKPELAPKTMNMRGRRPTVEEEGRKLERRLQIATAIISIAKALKNKEQYDCWSAILNSIDRLGAAGMSDDKQVLDTHGQQGIIVYAPVFRHPHFDALFDKVDSTRGC